MREREKNWGTKENPAWLKSEIVGSKELLEKNLGIQVKALSVYPSSHGLHNLSNARDVVKQASYEAAFTVWGLCESPTGLIR